MPLKQNNKKNYFQFGDGGKKYYYNPNSDISIGIAISKAKRQGRAMAVSKYGGELNFYTLKKSNLDNKKLMIITPDGHKIHFGASGYSDYTKNKNIDKKNAYIARHRINEDWSKKGIQTSGFWARWILWNKKTLLDSILDTAKRFNILINVE